MTTEHGGCRIQEFARWPRVVLEHERSYLSKVMSASAFLDEGHKQDLMHDISDIDSILSQLPVRVEVPGEEGV